MRGDRERERGRKREREREREREKEWRERGMLAGWGEVLRREGSLFVLRTGRVWSLAGMGNQRERERGMAAGWGEILTGGVGEREGAFFSLVDMDEREREMERGREKE